MTSKILYEKGHLDHELSLHYLRYDLGCVRNIVLNWSQTLEDVLLRHLSIHI